jgi:predicted permease
MNLSLSIFEVIERVLVIFVLMFFGIISRKFGFIKEEARQSLGDVMLNIALPSLIFGAMVSDIHLDHLSSSLLLPFISFLLILIGIFITLLLSRGLSIPADHIGTFTILCSMPNTGFIGFPVIFSLLGKEGLTYAVLFDFGSTVAFFSVAIMVVKGGHREQGWWRALLNPPLFAVIIGLAFNRSGLKLPTLVMEPLQIMGNTTIPLAMLLMGYMIAEIKLTLKSFNLKLIVIVLFKLLIYPLLAWIILLPFKMDPVIRTVILIEAAMPSMASTVVLVQKYGGDEKLAASGIFLTTLFSVMTIPLVIYLLL